MIEKKFPSVFPNCKCLLFFVVYITLSGLLGALLYNGPISIYRENMTTLVEDKIASSPSIKTIRLIFDYFALFIKEKISLSFFYL